MTEPATTDPRPAGRTHRSPDMAYAGAGAVRQRGGSLPIYVCNTCGREVVWVESAKTGRKYLANVQRGYLGQRFYIAARLHGDCAARLADEDWSREHRQHAAWVLHLVTDHELGRHASTPADQCLVCGGMTTDDAIIWLLEDPR